MCRRSSWSTFAGASRRRVGPIGKRSRINRRAFSWPGSRNSPATGARTTTEARLNALAQFTTNIDGLDIHFIHVKSRHENALPLLITHGWPGSVIELLKIV